MADLKIDYAAARNLGHDVSTEAENFSAEIAKVRSAVDSLKSVWTGSDADKYTQLIEEKAQEIDSLINTMNETGQYLVRVGDDYERVSEENKQSIN